MRRAAACLALCSTLALPAVASAEQTLTTSFLNGKGQTIGEATLVDTPNGVLVKAEIRGLPPGELGFHFHETGRCDAADGFESAGGHYAPRGKQHGFLSADGPHAGDMPNQFVGQDGVLLTHVLNARVTLRPGEATLLDADGSALLVHAGADDYSSQPSGEAGSRLACAAVHRR